MASTGYRRLRMTGLPWQMPELIVMRASSELMLRLCPQKLRHSSALLKLSENGRAASSSD